MLRDGNCLGKISCIVLVHDEYLCCFTNALRTSHLAVHLWQSHIQMVTTRLVPSPAGETSCFVSKVSLFQRHQANFTRTT